MTPVSIVAWTPSTFQRRSMVRRRCTSPSRPMVPTTEPPETGSVREDVLVLLGQVVERASSPLGRGLLRMMQAESAHPEVEQMKRQIYADHVRARAFVIERAVTRGELPEGTDADLVVELMFSPVIRRVVNRIAPADDEFLAATVDVVLTGVRGGAGLKRPPRPRAQGF